MNQIQSQFSIDLRELSDEDNSVMYYSSIEDEILITRDSSSEDEAGMSLVSSIEDEAGMSLVSSSDHESNIGDKSSTEIDQHMSTTVSPNSLSNTSSDEGGISLDSSSEDLLDEIDLSQDNNIDQDLELVNAKLPPPRNINSYIFCKLFM
jgi:hypothetical protein